MAEGVSMLKIDLGPNNGVKEFNSPTDLQEFLTNQRNYYNWLNVRPANKIGDIYATITNRLAQIQNNAGLLSENDKSRLSQIETQMTSLFREWQLPILGSPVANFIDGLRAQSPEMAAAALTTWLSQPNTNLQNYLHFKGAVLMVAFDAQIAPETPPAVQASLEALTRSFEQSRSTVEQDTAVQRQEFERVSKLHRRQIARIILRSLRQNHSIKQATEADVGHAIGSLQETEKIYKEHMRIRAPVTYWADKAQAHRKSSAKYGKILLGYAAIAAIALPAFLYVLADHVVTTATLEKPTAIYLINVAIGVVITTIGFWAGRILTRLYLSEMHLGIDAEERSVMAQTYLALTASSQATEEDRAIVLASLFRPTADGIVKDDAAPDLSPAALLSRLGSKS